MRDLSEDKMYAFEQFSELRMATLKRFAKSHGIKFGRVKEQMVWNILDACSTYEVAIETVPGRNATITLTFKPDA